MGSKRESGGSNGFSKGRSGIDSHDSSVPLDQLVPKSRRTENAGVSELKPPATAFFSAIRPEVVEEEEKEKIMPIKRGAEDTLRSSEIHLAVGNVGTSDY